MLLELGMNKTYCYSLDKTFKKAVAQAKSIFEDTGDPRMAGISWIQEVTGNKGQPIFSLNQFCLDVRYKYFKNRDRLPSNKVDNNDMKKLWLIALNIIKIIELIPSVGLSMTGQLPGPP